MGLVISVSLGGPAAARYASIVIDATTGRVLHSVNPDSRKHPASLTKMMTLYLLFEALRNGKLTPDQMLRVSYIASRRTPSKLGLKKGERISVRDVIGALITKSANDAATVAGEALAGSERRFARVMTKKARSLGMKRTTFRNASGLPHYKQVSTARDMAILSRALIRDFPTRYRYFSRQTFTFRGQTYRNHNRLLDSYEGLDGIKTGYIRSSGFNLAASAKRDGRRVIGVIFGGKSSRWRDRQMTRILDKGFTKLGPAEATPTSVASRRPSSGKVKKLAAAPLSSDSDRWAIQVGAFKRYAPARKAVDRATRALTNLNGSRTTVVPDEGTDGRVYRARVVGLSESLARSSCVRLKRKKIRCMVVPSDASLAQGSQ